MMLLVSSVGMAWAGGSHHHGHASADWWPRKRAPLVTLIDGELRRSGRWAPCLGR
jgi:hypothetical protein